MIRDGCVVDSCDCIQQIGRIDSDIDITICGNRRADGEHKVCGTRVAFGHSNIIDRNRGGIIVDDCADAGPITKHNSVRVGDVVESASGQIDFKGLVQFNEIVTVDSHDNSGGC